MWAKGSRKNRTGVSKGGVEKERGGGKKGERRRERRR